MAWHTREEIKRLAASDRRAHDHVSGNEGAATEAPADPLCGKVHPALGFACHLPALHSGKHWVRVLAGDISWTTGGIADTSAPPSLMSRLRNPTAEFTCGAYYAACDLFCRRAAGHAGDHHALTFHGLPMSWPQAGEAEHGPVPAYSDDDGQGEAAKRCEWWDAQRGVRCVLAADHLGAHEAWTEDGEPASWWAVRPETEADARAAAVNASAREKDGQCQSVWYFSSLRCELPAGHAGDHELRGANCTKIQWSDDSDEELDGDNGHRAPLDHYAFTYNGLRIDPYRVAEIYGIEDVRQFHAIKKLLRAGRGAKSLRQDVEEARWTLSRWLEMMDEDG